uniref:AB hydrolase-1 domain-containing protein n=1 Tax=Alexandrium catenella TaxID=2925 RepID=A0A7S1S514_ALECA
MGNGAAAGMPQVQPMRCRQEGQVPKCFRYVKCPYPKAQEAYGSYGCMNYSLVGREGGEVVVCFHGLNGSRMLYQDLGEFLSKQGDFRVLSFDLYGHGLSNAPRVDLCPCRTGCSRPSSCGPPRGRYDLDFFVQQTDELLELIGLGDEPVNLIGFSLGGTVAVAFAQRYPARVKRLAAMSPSGFIPKVPPLYYLLRASWCCLVPLAPHVLCTCWYKRERFARSIRSEGQEMDDEVIDNLWSRFVWQLYVKRGVASATLAVCSRVPWFNLKPLFQDAGRHERPVLLLWGERDNLNPPQTVAQEVKKCFSNVQLMVVPNAGHIVICDKPRQVFFAILAFLQLSPDARVQNASLDRPVLKARQPNARAVAPPACVAAGAERAAQMPVPVILGHTEDVQSSLQERDGSSSGALLPI